LLLQLENINESKSATTNRKETPAKSIFKQQQIQHPSNKTNEMKEQKVVDF